jgi:hypothetical protein
MISKEQMERAEREFTSEAATWFQKAKEAERSLEAYTYGPRRDYSPLRRDKLLEDFRDADYMAESRAWILNLIRRPEPAIHHSAVCFFKDGNRWCCVNGDFVNLQESAAGFGETFEEALIALQEAREQEQFGLKRQMVAPLTHPVRPHMHVNSGIRNDDSCKDCGRDLRDPIHLRSE